MSAEEIMAAVQAGDLEKVKALLGDAGATTTAAGARDAAGVSAIMHALYRGRRDIAEVLAAAKGELDIFEATALGRRERVEELMRGKPSEVGALSGDGFTALHFACFFGQDEVAALLLAHEARVDAVSKNAMMVMPLHSATAGHRREIVRMLLEKGAPANAKQQAGWAPLHEAAQSGDVELVELLLKHGADSRQANDAGVTALQLAREKGHEAVAKKLESL
jgi:ankyrin repeat protein